MSIWLTSSKAVENSYSVNDNTSNVTVSIIVGWNYGSWAGDNPRYRIYVDGSLVKSGNANFNTAQNSSGSQTVASWTGNIPHSDDGSKTISWTVQYEGIHAYEDIWTSHSGTTQLTTIPRATVISGGSGDIGGSALITLTRYSANFTNTISYSFGQLSGTIVSGYTENSYEWTIPSSFYAQIPSAPNGTGTLTCVTYNEGVQIGSAQTCTFTATANEAASKPTVSLTLENLNPQTTLTGSQDIYIKNYTNVRATGTAAARNSAAISSIAIVNGSAASTTSPATFNAILNGSFTFSAIDSRGYTSSTTITKQLIDYYKPTIQLVPSALSALGAITLSVSGTWFKGSFGAANNTLQIQTRYKEGEGSWTAWTNCGSTDTSTANYSGSKEYTGFDYTLTYTFQARVIDALNTVLTSEIKVRSIPVFDWGKEDFNFNCDVNINGEIYQNGEPFSGGTKDYTTLYNKPSINGVPLVGNKTFNELNIDIANIKGKKLLWSNPSPDSAFNGQTITLSDNADNYDMLIFISSYQGKTNTKSHSDFVFGGTSNATIVTYKDSTTNTSTDTTMAWRNVSISGVSVTINNAMYNSASAGGYNRNDLCIPAFIYGVNFNSVGSRITEGASGIVKLWERSSTAGVSTATYTLSDTADFYIIKSLYRKDGTDTSLCNSYCIAMDGVRVSTDVYATDGRFIEMRSYKINGTSFQVYQGYEHDSDGGSTALNDYCVPVAAYGAYVRQTILKNHSYTYNLPI